MATDTPARLDSSEWVGRARSLAPVVAQYRDEMETMRHMPLPLADAMRERGLFSLWLPKALGGPELPIETEVQVMEELGRLDGSVGWNSMISTNHSILWAHIAHEVAAECTKGGRTVIAGTIGGGGSREAPGGGVAVKVDGGFRITGKWAFASGCHHADWMVANGRISEKGELRRTPQGNVGLFSFLLQPSEVTLLDTARQVDECFARTDDVSDDLGALMRCAASTASLSSTAVVDALYTAAGSGGIYITSRLDRCFRDIHTLITHTVGGIAGLPVAGRYYLGLGLANPL